VDGDARGHHWALVGSAAFASAAAGAPGDLDGSFSGDGWFRTLEVRSPSNNYLPRGAEDVAVQRDGRIVAVGELIDGTSSWYFGAFRYLPNGELDPSFGEGGWVDTNLGNFEFPRAVALQPDGGIVVAGGGDCRYTLCFVLARYLPDGSLDPGFGDGGIVRTSFGQLHGSKALDVALAPDGRLVAAGFVRMFGDAQDSSHFAVARYLPDGRLDPSFSRDGRATVDFGYGNDIAYGVATQGGGRIVVAGQGTRNRYRTEDDFAFARFRRNGRLDRGFSGDGKRTVSFGRGSLRRRLPAGHEGPLHLCDGEHRGGSGAGAGGGDWALLRYRQSGRLDQSFGGDGIVVTDFGSGEDSARALTFHDGRILAAGSIYTTQGLARYVP